MGILERLGRVIKSYLNDNDDPAYLRSGNMGHGDPDFQAAYEELDDFLHRKHSKWTRWEEEKPKPVPEGIRQDFAELGLGPEATAEECKDAYKKLLKIHHPDRHAKHLGNLKKATEKTARVNAAYERLMKWYR